jgi:probable HAF family extracellular repeat protein
MSLARRPSYSASAIGRRTLSPGVARAGAALALGLLAACGVDLPTDPSAGATLAPSSGLRALTGATSTPIFPTAAPGDAQPTGDARGLNASGQVTGSVFLANVNAYRPYRWTPGSGHVTLTGCCDNEWGADVNDAGVVVGTAQTSLIVGNRGFVAAGTSMTPLPVLQGALPDAHAGAVAINNAGQIVGFSPAPDFTLNRHAVLWSSNLAILDLGTLGGSNSAAIDVNASGQVIGWSEIAGNAATHFFLWSSGTGMQDLATIIGPTVSGVVEINDAGQIIGTYVAPGGQSHAFLYTPGAGLRDLGTLGGATSSPTGLNNNGQVVGISTLGNGGSHAFLWTPTDGMEDVTALTGIVDVGRLNDNLQTLTGTVAPTAPPQFSTSSIPRIVQLSFTASAADAPPVAAFTWSCAGNKCSFDASGSTDDHGIVSYVWDLDRDRGRGKSSGVIARTNYPKSGTHDVTLTVTDTKGQTASVTHTVVAN